MVHEARLNSALSFFYLHGRRSRVNSPRLQIARCDGTKPKHSAFSYVDSGPHRCACTNPGVRSNPHRKGEKGERRFVVVMRRCAKICALRQDHVRSQVHRRGIVNLHAICCRNLVGADQVPWRPDSGSRIEVAVRPHLCAKRPQQHAPPCVHRTRRNAIKQQPAGIPGRSLPSVPTRECGAQVWISLVIWRDVLGCVVVNLRRHPFLYDDSGQREVLNSHFSSYGRIWRIILPYQDSSPIFDRRRDRVLGTQSCFSRRPQLLFSGHSPSVRDPQTRLSHTAAGAPVFQIARAWCPPICTRANKSPPHRKPSWQCCCLEVWPCTMSSQNGTKIFGAGKKGEAECHSSIEEPFCREQGCSPSAH